jgi:anti-sigma B factor antagonist
VAEARSPHRGGRSGRLQFTMGTERLCGPALDRRLASTIRATVNAADRTPAPLLDVVVCELPPEYLVAVAGELDLASAPELALTLRGLDRAGHLVTLDLRALTFIDVAGVRALQDAWRITGEAGRRLQILGPDDDVTRVLELTGTLDLVR